MKHLTVADYIGQAAIQIPKYSHTSSEMHEIFSGDALAMAVEFGLKWYLDAKTASTGSLQRENSPRLPLLVFALSFDEPVVRKAGPPDYTMVEKLLIHGADPTQRCVKFTVWQYVIHHLLLTDAMKSEDIAKWSKLCVLLLQHGADPYACSPEISIFCDPLFMLESAMDNQFSGTEVRSQDSPHFLGISATSMIRDTFGGHCSYEQLTRMLQEKKTTTSHSRGKKKSRKRRKTNNVKGESRAL